MQSSSEAMTFLILSNHLFYFLSLLIIGISVQLPHTELFTNAIKKSLFDEQIELGILFRNVLRQNLKKHKLLSIGRLLQKCENEISAEFLSKHTYSQTVNLDIRLTFWHK